MTMLPINKMLMIYFIVLYNYLIIKLLQNVQLNQTKYNLLGIRTKKDK